MSDQVDDAVERATDFRALFSGPEGYRFLQALVDDEIATVVPAGAPVETYQRAEGARTVVLDILQKAGRRLVVSAIDVPQQAVDEQTDQ